MHYLNLNFNIILVFISVPEINQLLSSSLSDRAKIITIDQEAFSKKGTNHYIHKCAKYK